jgi:hypothetical protein
VKPTRALPIAVLALSLLATPYAAARSHPHSDLATQAGGGLGPQPLPTSRLSVGAGPTIAYAVASRPGFAEGDWRLHRPDGTTLRLPHLTWTSWAPLGKGAIGMAGTEDGPELQRVFGSGRVRSRLVQHFGLAVSPDHRIVGWLGDHRSVHVVEAGGRQHLALPRIPSGRRLVAVRGGRTCQEPEGSGCTVFVDAARRVVASSSHGRLTRVGPVRQVADVDQRGRLAGLAPRPASQQRQCWGVWRADGRRVFRTCRYFLDSFSPDGHSLLAERSTVRWASVTRFAVLDDHGDVVASWTIRPGPHRGLSQLTWEDDAHLLGVLHAHGRWGVVRIGIDGTVEYAGTPVAATADLTPYSLPLR